MPLWIAFICALILATCCARRNFSCSTVINRSLSDSFCCSIDIFSPSSFSTSCRLRSREDWAAWRFRSTRSIRRCSFSSSVFARFLYFTSALITNERTVKITHRGGRFVLGVGSSCPQDFRFFVGFFDSSPSMSSSFML